MPQTATQCTFSLPGGSVLNCVGRVNGADASAVGQDSGTSTRLIFISRRANQRTAG
jgi:hypothetical protein